MSEKTENYSDKFKIIEINLNNILKDKDSITNPMLLLYVVFSLIGDRENGFRLMCEKFGLNSAETRQAAKELNNRLKAIKGEIPPEVLDDKSISEDKPIIIEEMEAYEMFAGELYLERGIEQGKKEIAQISRLFVKEKKTPDEIAKELKISAKKVKAALIDLGYDLD